VSSDQTFNAKAFEYYPRLNKVRRYFETHYSQGFSLEDAAKIAGWETKHFGKYFRRRVGIGFKEWTTITRIELAIDMMQSEHQELPDIALAVGYEEYRTFERAFKKYIRLTPSQYRKVVISKLSDPA
jgi:transcriptional regulator GlxA family with amidase domain